MPDAHELNCFLNPKSVAVVGASNRFGAWGYMVLSPLIRGNFAGNIYPVNPNESVVLGLSSFSCLKDIPGSVDLVIVAVPAPLVPQVILDATDKGIKGAVIITAGFSESHPDGKKMEQEMVQLARSKGMRLIGPNVSGIFNVKAGFNATPNPSESLIDCPITFICQGGFAINNVLHRGSPRGMGVNRFYHTGNEADLTVTDFLEFFGQDPETKVILMYIEGLRDPRRFFEVAERITPNKPVIVIKGGGTEEGARAAASHTGAIAGSQDIFEGLFNQANIVKSPNMEVILDMGYAFLEQPPLRGNRVAILVMGGSWGVLLTDTLSKRGLKVPLLSDTLRSKLAEVGMPYRASTKNPIDIGAASGTIDSTGKIRIIEELMASDEIDAVITHGNGHIGFWKEGYPKDMLHMIQDEVLTIKGAYEVSQKYQKPVIVGNMLTMGESQAVKEQIANGYRVFHRLDDMAETLYAMYSYYRRKN